MTLSDTPGTEAWRYLVVFNPASSRKPKIATEEVFRRTEPLPKRPDAEDREDPERLTQTALEQINANKAFREVAEFLRTISYQHLVPQVVRDPKGFSPAPIQDDPFGRDLLMRIWGTNRSTRDAWLRRIQHALASAIPQLEPGFTYGKKGVSFIRQNLSGFDRATVVTPLLCLVDSMDTGDLRPPQVVQRWLAQPTRTVCRLAVREIESWILADTEGVARLLRIAPVKVPVLSAPLTALSRRPTRTRS